MRHSYVVYKMGSQGRMAIAKKTRYGLCKLKSCKLRFRKKNTKHLFCCREHKDTFHKRGEFPFEQVKADILGALRAELRAEIARLRARLDALERAADASARMETPIAPEGYRVRNGGAGA